MGRQIRTTLPQVMQHLIQNWSFLKSFRQLDKKYKGVQKRNYDRYHRARPLPELADDTPVWIRTENSQQSVSASGEPRSYIVSTLLDKSEGTVITWYLYLLKPAHQRLNLKPNLMPSLNKVQYKPGLELVQRCALRTD